MQKRLPSKPWKEAPALGPWPVATPPHTNKVYQSVTVLTAWQLMRLQALAAAKVTPQYKVNWRNENNKVQDSKQSQWKVACILQRLSPRLQTHIPATTLLRVCIPRLVSVWISTCINYKLKFKRIKSDRIMDCRHAKRLVAGRLLMCHSCMCGLMQPDAVSEKDVHQLVYIIRTEVRS